MRIVSLLPAATELVAALDLEGSLVGITHECDWPPAVSRVPRVTSSAVDAGADAATIDASVRALSEGGGSLFTLDARRLAELAPDVILTQRLCDVCAVSETDVRALAARLPLEPRIVTLDGTSLDAVFDDVTRVAGALGVPARGEALVATLRARMRAVHETLAAARAPRPRVVVIEWTDPIFAAGHWVPEMVRRAGGVDAIARPGEHSRPRTVQEVRESAPELIVVAPCGFSLERAAADARALIARDDWAWARTGPLWAMDGNAYVSRPGPRLVDGIEILARIFHPALFEPMWPAGAVRIA